MTTTDGRARAATESPAIPGGRLRDAGLSDERASQGAGGGAASEKPSPPPLPLIEASPILGAVAGLENPLPRQAEELRGSVPPGDSQPGGRCPHASIGGSRLHLQPITIGEARAFIATVHRHHEPRSTADRFAVAVNDGERVVGVAIISNPTARMVGRDYTAEVSRLATFGHKNACSMLYAAAWRACRALGYRRLITYILSSEPGTSLRAAGWRLVAEVRGASWHRERRPRVDRHPTQDKLRWEISA